MKGRDLSLQGIPQGDFQNKVEETIDHTLQTLSEVYRLFYDQSNFSSEFKVDISKLNIENKDFERLFMLMFLHDFYKLTAQKEHARLGADFLAQPENVELIRYHDALGIINTGEASLRSLIPLITFLSKLDPKKRKDFLQGLVILTMSDVASLGFLNDSRIKTYQSVVTQIEQVITANNLDKIVKDDTASRLRHLIHSNNRCCIELGLIENCLELYAEKETFKDKLQYVRFDAGAYVLEPLIRYLHDPSTTPNRYSLASKEIFTVTDKDIVLCWIDILYQLVRDVCRDCVIDLNGYSLKNDAGLNAFNTWAKFLNDNCPTHEIPCIYSEHPPRGKGG